MRGRLLIAAACLAAVAGLAGSGCSGGGSRTTATTGTATSTATAPARAGRAARDLEALLPDRVAGKKLEKRSATGTSVLSGGDAFSGVLTRFLASRGEKPAGLRFANAHDRARKLDLEPAFRATTSCAQSRRPRDPAPRELESSTATVSGKPVTRLLYPSGSTLYLYARGDLVYYVGTQNEDLARTVLASFR